MRDLVDQLQLVSLFGSCIHHIFFSHLSFLNVSVSYHRLTFLSSVFYQKIKNIFVYNNHIKSTNFKNIFLK